MENDPKSFFSPNRLSKQQQQLNVCPICYETFRLGDLKPILFNHIDDATSSTTTSYTAFRLFKRMPGSILTVPVHIFDLEKELDTPFPYLDNMSIKNLDLDSFNYVHYQFISECYRHGHCYPFKYAICSSGWMIRTIYESEINYLNLELAESLSNEDWATPPFIEMAIELLKSIIKKEEDLELQIALTESLEMSDSKEKMDTPLLLTTATISPIPRLNEYQGVCKMSDNFFASDSFKHEDWNDTKFANVSQSVYFYQSQLGCNVFLSKKHTALLLYKLYLSIAEKASDRHGVLKEKLELLGFDVIDNYISYRFIPAELTERHIGSIASNTCEDANPLEMDQPLLHLSSGCRYWIASP
jgi:hypothetical protein